MGEPLLLRELHEDNVHTKATFNLAKRQYRLANIKMPALLPMLSDRFWPTYDFARAQRYTDNKRKPGVKKRFADLYTRDHRGCDMPRALPARSRKTRQADRISADNTVGLDTGIAVDVELGEITRLVKLYGVPLYRFLDDDEIPVTIDDKQDRFRFRELQKNGKVFTKKIVAYLLSQEWTPIHSQLVVHTTDGTVATKADLICKTMSGALVVIDVKCGFKPDTLRCSTGHAMNAPFEDINDCRYNQHQIQVQLTRHMYVQSMPRTDEKVFAALLYARDNGVTRPRMSSLIKDRLEKAVKVIASSQKNR